jgi:hypothetical protein
MTIAHDSEHRSSAGKAGRRATYAAGALALALFWLAGPAEARVPPFSASCPGRIDVQADNGGRIFINGQPARVRAFDDRSYEARLGRIAVSVVVGPGGRLDVSSRMRGPDAVCRVRAPRVEPPRDGPMGPMGQMAAVCRDRAAAEFRVRRSEIVTNMPFRDGRRFVVPGSFRDRGQPSAFACTFDATGRLLSVR